jgi:hypothetical protein
MSERSVIAKLLDRVLAKGYVVSVNDGEEWVAKKVDDKATILKAMFSTDEEWLLIRNSEGHEIGRVYLVYGNAADGSEVIADHSDNDEINALVTGL